MIIGMFNHFSFELYMQYTIKVSSINYFQYIIETVTEFIDATQHPHHNFDPRSKMTRLPRGFSAHSYTSSVIVTIMALNFIEIGATTQYPPISIKPQFIRNAVIFKKKQRCRKNKLSDDKVTRLWDLKKLYLATAPKKRRSTPSTHSTLSQS